MCYSGFVFTFPSRKVKNKYQNHSKFRNEKEILRFRGNRQLHFTFFPSFPVLNLVFLRKKGLLVCFLLFPEQGLASNRMWESVEIQDHSPNGQISFTELSLGTVICIKYSGSYRRGRQVSALKALHWLLISLKFLGPKVDCEILCCLQYLRKILLSDSFFLLLMKSSSLTVGNHFEIKYGSLQHNLNTLV